MQKPSGFNNIKRKSLGGSTLKGQSTAHRRGRSVSSAREQSQSRAQRRGPKSAYSGKESVGMRSKAKYQKVSGEDDGIELSQMDLMQPTESYKGAKNPDAWKPHEIYENTMY